MNEAKKSLADNQGEIRQIKEKIEKEIAIQKQIEDQMKQLQKEIIQKKRIAQSVVGTSSSSIAQNEQQ